MSNSTPITGKPFTDFSLSSCEQFSIKTGILYREEIRRQWREGYIKGRDAIKLLRDSHNEAQEICDKHGLDVVRDEVMPTLLLQVK